MKQLRVFVESDLKDTYKEAAVKHNENFMKSQYADSGFDLLAPETVTLTRTQLVNYRIKCAMYNMDDDTPSAYYLYPRSSIYKTGFRMANSTGIIDRGYRGNICAALDLLQGSSNCVIEKGQRIVQLCEPSLEPFMVVIVETEEELGRMTERGTNGFGSTGK